MKKYMIEREIPKIGTLEREQWQQGAAKSNQVLRPAWAGHSVAAVVCDCRQDVLHVSGRR
jgi:hypothetical protein